MRVGQEGYITPLGGDFIGLFEFDTTTNTLVTASLVSGTNFMDMGHISDCKCGLRSNTTPWKADNGKTITKISTDREAYTEATLGQSSKELADWIKYTTVGKKYIEVVHNGYKKAKHQETIKVGEVDNSFEIASTTTNIPYKFIGTPLDAAVALTTTQWAAMKTAIGTSVAAMYNTAASSIPAGQEDLMIET